MFVLAIVLLGVAAVALLALAGLPPSIRVTRLANVLGPGCVVAACGLGLAGVWLAMVADWIVRAFLFLLRYWRGRWKKIKVIE